MATKDKVVKIIRDPIHGYIGLTATDLEFVDTETFQRLRRIRQSGCHTVYPSANHTRFEHSLGVMYLGTRVLEAVVSKAPVRVRKQLLAVEDTVRYACLLHDLGHAPLSHTGEAFFQASKLRDILKNRLGVPLGNGAPHEYMSCVVALDIFGDQLKHIGVDLELFCRMITGNPYPGESMLNGVIDILNSPVDVDKLDYLSRDSYSAGTGNTLVSIDTERLVGAYSIKKGCLCFDRSALSVVANFVYARSTLYMWVYAHHITVYTDSLMHRFIENAVNELPDFADRHFSIAAIEKGLIDDSDLHHQFRQFRDRSEVFRSLYDQFYGRKYFRSAWKTLFHFEEYFNDAAKRKRITETNPSLLERELVDALKVKPVNIIVATADFRFKSPTVYLDLGKGKKAFEEVYEPNIYTSLYDKIPMVFAERSIDVEKVKKALTGKGR